MWELIFFSPSNKECRGAWMHDLCDFFLYKLKWGWNIYSYNGHEQIMPLWIIFLELWLEFQLLVMELGWGEISEWIYVPESIWMCRVRVSVFSLWLRELLCCSQLFVSWMSDLDLLFMWSKYIIVLCNGCPVIPLLVVFTLTLCLDKKTEGKGK